MSDRLLGRPAMYKIVFPRTLKRVVVPFTAFPFLGFGSNHCPSRKNGTSSRCASPHSCRPFLKRCLSTMASPCRSSFVALGLALSGMKGLDSTSRSSSGALCQLATLAEASAATVPPPKLPTTRSSGKENLCWCRSKCVDMFSTAVWYASAHHKPSKAKVDDHTVATNQYAHKILGVFSGGEPSMSMPKHMPHTMLPIMSSSWMASIISCFASLMSSRIAADRSYRTSCLNTSLATLV
mmetsp:Transcript_41310/g.74682  ORF Transcript_41310/g.74682 Transcript_41310/m.74682 type:complete len:238 (+) Transcript_41310:1897-2610(+)